MKTRIILLLSLLSISVANISAQNPPYLISETDYASLPATIPLTNKIYSISSLWSEIKFNLVSLDKIGFDMDSLYRESLDKIIDSENDIEYLDELERFAAAFNDGHTGIFSVDYDLSEYINDIPATIREIDRKFYFTQIKKRAGLSGELLGARIVEIAETPVDEYVRKNYFPYFAETNEDRKWSFSTERMEQGLKGHYFEGKAETRDGRVVPFKIQYNWESLRKREDEYWDMQRSERRPRIDAAWEGDVAKLFIKDFSEDMVGMLDSVMVEIIPKAKGIIVDLRQNGGGVTDVAWQLQFYLCGGDSLRSFAYQTRVNNAYGRSKGDYEPEKYADFLLNRAYENYPHEVIYRDEAVKAVNCPVVVLIGKFTYSACEDFLINIYELPDRPLLVGQQTGGSTGSPLAFELPDGIIARVCTLRALFPYSNTPFLEGIKPDIEVKSTFEDFVNGKDPVYERGMYELKKLIDY